MDSMKRSGIEHIVKQRTREIRRAKTIAKKRERETRELLLEVERLKRSIKSQKRNGKSQRS